MKKVIFHCRSDTTYSLTRIIAGTAYTVLKPETLLLFEVEHGLCNETIDRRFLFGISLGINLKLTSLAQHAGRPEDQLAQELLAAGLTEYYSQDELWKRWETLTPREREVTALICLGYTNRQAAVKFHVSYALEKIGVETRSQLQ